MQKGPRACLIIKIMEKREKRVLAFRVPCYNEEAILERSAAVLEAELDKMVGRGLVSPENFIMFADDGSRDRTWNIIKEIWCVSIPRVMKWSMGLGENRTETHV